MIDLLLQAGSDLDRLHLTLEGTGEDAVDSTLDAALGRVDGFSHSAGETHVPPLLLLVL